MVSEKQEQEKVSKFIRIVHDDLSESPREWGNTATMFCQHKRYILGDQYVEDLREEELDNYYYLPLYLYDHGGITMNTTGFSCPWDSGQVGRIWIHKEEVKDQEEAEKIMVAEVEIYDLYLSGRVYGFHVVEETKCKCCGNVSEEIVDSCYGFYGDNFEENGLLDRAGYYDENEGCEVKKDGI